MGFLRFIWKEIRRLSLAVKIAGLVFGIAVIVSIWRLGGAWWFSPINVAPWYVPRRLRPRLEYFAVIACVLLLPCLALLFDRYRKGR